MPARRRRSRSSEKLSSGEGDRANRLENGVGMGDSCFGEEGLDGVGEGGPGNGEVGEAAGAGGGEGVVDAAAAVDGFALGGEGSVALKVVEDGVHDAFAEGDG